MSKTVKSAPKKLLKTAAPVKKVAPKTAKKNLPATPTKKVVAPVKKVVSKAVVKVTKPAKDAKVSETPKKSFAEEKRINVAAQQKKKHDMKTLTNL